jgi:hypothetical protein
MTDRIRFDRSPSAAFADRLERELLETIGARTATAGTSNPADNQNTSEEDQLMTLQLHSDAPGTGERPRNTWKWLALTAGVIALVAAIAAVLPGRRSDDVAVDGGAPVTFVVRWQYSETKDACAPTDSPTPICLSHFDIPATARFNGDVDGVGLQAVYWNAPVDYPDRPVDHLEHIGTYLVQATVAGCGTGQFMMVELMQFVSGADHDRDTGTYTGTWQIVDGSGRGALRNVAGSGTSKGVFGTAADEGRTFSGTIGCTAG